jgi:hypothetical protein
MAKRLGNDARLWIKDGAGTYHLISGNMNLSRQLQSQTIDTSTKSDFPWGTQAPGTRGLTISATFLPDLPDANGFEALAGIATDLDEQNTATVQIRTGGASGADPADVIFEGEVYVTDFSDEANMNSPHTHSCTLVAAAAPTVYEL